MAEEIRVRIIPGCPVRVIAETEEDRVLAEEALGNVECGCVVETEAAIEEAEAALAKAEALVAEGKTEEAEAVAAEAKAKLEEAEEAPVCSLEPEKPWEESVCGVVAKEAGRQAADKVMVRLREEGLIA